MDEITRSRAIAFCVFWLGVSISFLIGNTWPKLGDATLVAVSSWLLHLVRIVIPALLAKLFTSRQKP